MWIQETKKDGYHMLITWSYLRGSGQESGSPVIPLSTTAHSPNHSPALKRKSILVLTPLLIFNIMNLYHFRAER